MRFRNHNLHARMAFNMVKHLWSVPQIITTGITVHVMSTLKPVFRHGVAFRCKIAADRRLREAQIPVEILVRNLAQNGLIVSSRNRRVPTVFNIAHQRQTVYPTIIIGITEHAMYNLS